MAVIGEAWKAHARRGWSPLTASRASPEVGSLGGARSGVTGGPGVTGQARVAGELASRLRVAVAVRDDCQAAAIGRVGAPAVGVGARK